MLLLSKTEIKCAFLCSTEAIFFRWHQWLIQMWLIQTVSEQSNSFVWVDWVTFIPVYIVISFTYVYPGHVLRIHNLALAATKHQELYHTFAKIILSLKFSSTCHWQLSSSEMVKIVSKLKTVKTEKNHRYFIYNFKYDDDND